MAPMSDLVVFGSRHSEVVTPLHPAQRNYHLVGHRKRTWLPLTSEAPGIVSPRARASDRTPRWSSFCTVLPSASPRRSRRGLGTIESTISRHSGHVTSTLAR